MCSETTGHAEVVQIRFDPEIVSFADILRVFFTVHDPTQLNRQGNDIGESYRSAIFFHSPEQERIAHEIKSEIEELKIYGREIVTEITPFSEFYVGEDYHQEYFARNPIQPYCMGVVAPKVAKFRKMWRERLKK